MTAISHRIPIIGLTLLLAEIPQSADTLPTMITITELDQNIDLLEFNGKKLYLIGTAHVSLASAELVENKIHEFRPDTVCLELCQGRFDSLQNPNRWRETDIYSVIRSGKAYVLMAQLALAGFQRSIAKELGVRPGEEMFRGIKAAQETSAKVELIDRDVKITLKRAWSQAGFFSLLRLFFSLIISMFRSSKIEKHDIEELKKGDALNSILAEFSDLLPGLKTTLIDERDEYLAAKLFAAPGSVIVGVVGAGHVPGIKEALGKEIDLPSLETIPPPRISTQIISWSIPALIIGMFIYGFFHGGSKTSTEMIASWIILTGALSALGAIVALAHPLTVITSFVAAPFTTLHPILAAGWFAGIVEAIVRKPRVSDLESVADDISSWRGIWRNRALKILLIVVMVNLGASLGALFGFGKLANLL